jgi:UDPglucose 6-dehydrogenase
MGDFVAKIIRASGISEKAFSVVSNPEFLREGSAVSDFFNPDRIVIGASNNRAFNVITELYRPLNAHFVFTDVTSAEIIKYASNAFLATKISFINEISWICEKVNADVTAIADAMGLDRRIGRAFLNAGIGFGGSCLPKDVAALLNLFEKNGCTPQILAAVNKVNESQIGAFAEKIITTLGNVSGKKIAVLGIAFKPETDDIREAPAVKLIRLLLEKGAVVSAYDPVAETRGKSLLPQVTFCPGTYEVVRGADAIVLATEWAEFREIDLLQARKLVKNNFIFDGRNILNAKKVKEAGFRYFGVGR